MYVYMCKLTRTHVYYVNICLCVYTYRSMYVYTYVRIKVKSMNVKDPPARNKYRLLTYYLLPGKEDVLAHSSLTEKDIIGLTICHH